MGMGGYSTPPEISPRSHVPLRGCNRQGVGLVRSRRQDFVGGHLCSLWGHYEGIRPLRPRRGLSRDPRARSPPKTLRGWPLITFFSPENPFLFEFENSETTSSRMFGTYAQIRSQNVRTQNIRVFRAHKPLFLSKIPLFWHFSVKSAI